jgi:sugar/nucleoside kinase (ribokinase family)
MTSVERPKIFGAGLIALDLVVSSDPQMPVRSWAGGTCGNVLSIMAFLGWNAYPIARLNGDPASIRVHADMERWGVRLDYASCSPTAHTPIIIQEIRRGHDGRPKHRFSWSCPRCGELLPGFKAVTVEAAEAVTPALAGASVFFLDRLSRATLILATRASEEGAVVVFEPSSKGADRLFTEAIQLAHIVKYADERLGGIEEATRSSSAILAEIQTLGEHGLRYRHRFGRGCISVHSPHHDLQIPVVPVTGAAPDSLPRSRPEVRQDFAKPVQEDCAKRCVTARHWLLGTAASKVPAAVCMP